MIFALVRHTENIRAFGRGRGRLVRSLHVRSSEPRGGRASGSSVCLMEVLPPSFRACLFPSSIDDGMGSLNSRIPPVPLYLHSCYLLICHPHCNGAGPPPPCNISSVWPTTIIVRDYTMY
jgi:hypothetical protein